MDISPKYLWNFQCFDDGVEAFCFRIATMRNTINNKEMYVTCSFQTMKESYFLADPIWFGRMGWTITMRFREAFSLSFSSSSKSPGCMSVGAKNTGFIGLRCQPCSLHKVEGIRYPSSFFCSFLPHAISWELYDMNAKYLKCWVIFYFLENYVVLSRLSLLVRCSLIRNVSVVEL